MVKNSKKTPTTDIQPTLFPLESVSGKKVEVSFSAPDLSSQGGLLLLREFDSRIGFVNSLSDCLDDKRSPYLIRHSHKEMLTQRIFQIAAGYEDADDCDLLRNDSLLKICSGRTAESSPLSSQPTISRFENSVGIREAYRMGECFVEEFIRSYGDQQPRYIIIDCDDSNFNAYGNQQGTLFNNYYDEYCYMPLLIFEGISGKMILPMLRCGRRSKTVNIFGVLRRLIERLRQHWPCTHFIVRGDGHFCSKEFMEWTENKKNVSFIFGLAGNTVLSRMIKEVAKNATEMYRRSKKDIKIYRSLTYQAGSWSHPQRVIVKIEVNSKGTNIRYVVTSFKRTQATFLYKELYCGRGTMELYIKELKNYLAADRTSCCRFLANQFRLYLHAAAYVLLQGIKQEVFKDTYLENVCILTFRQKILLSAAHVRNLKTKIIIELSREHPHRNELTLALQRFALWKNTG